MSREEAIALMTAPEHENTAFLIRAEGREVFPPGALPLPEVQTSSCAPPDVRLLGGSRLPDRIEVDYEAACPSIVVALEFHAARWAAYVDGASSPVFPAEFGNVATAVPGGKHHVVFAFEPRTTRWAWFSLASFAAILLMAAIGLTRRRSRCESGPPTKSPGP